LERAEDDVDCDVDVERADDEDEGVANGGLCSGMGDVEDGTGVVMAGACGDGTMVGEVVAAGVDVGIVEAGVSRGPPLIGGEESEAGC